MCKKHYGSETCTPNVKPTTNPSVVSSGEPGVDNRPGCNKPNGVGHVIGNGGGHGGGHK